MPWIPPGDRPPPSPSPHGSEKSFLDLDDPFRAHARGRTPRIRDNPSYVANMDDTSAPDDHLPPIALTDERFRALIQVSRFGLINKSNRLGGDVVRQISRWTHFLENTMRRKEFSGKNHEESLTFLSTFRRQLDDSGLSEAAGLRIWPSFLSGAAQHNFNTYFDDEAAGFST